MKIYCKTLPTSGTRTFGASPFSVLWPSGWKHTTCSCLALWISKTRSFRTCLSPLLTCLISSNLPWKLIRSDGGASSALSEDTLQTVIAITNAILREIRVNICSSPFILRWGTLDGRLKTRLVPAILKEVPIPQKSVSASTPAR